jgi:hypothetical protein
VEKLDLLSVALGLAALAGVNLYLTVFATGLAIHFHWITLAPQYQSLEVLGNPSPALTVIIVLLAGGTSLLAHTAKAATRLASNTSPEPLSNIGLSLGEDAAVLGGLTLVNFSPLLALIIFLIAIGVFFYFARRILRSIKGKIGAARKKLDEPADRNVSVQ